MRYFREPAQRIGWLFIVATAAGVLSVVTMASTLGEDDLLAAVERDQGSLIVGNMLVFVMLVAMVGTAVLLAPVLGRHSRTLSLGYVLARAFEVVTIAIGLVAALLLVPLSWTVASADRDELAASNVLADTLETASDWTGYLGAQMVFSISALVLNWAFYRYAMVPRWLSVWGLVGVPLMFASGFLMMFESLESNATTVNLLVVPLAVQEMVMAVWLIVKGFDDVGDDEPDVGDARRAERMIDAAVARSS
ncbi:DUF4386 domain-containing protein [Ilumatobacter sp.]|uniref:DUF4386 domain-containing protein n=1 Tax=Ilumatobacter sp. TaxID=1967498 RepID=UPI003AF57B62